MRVLLVEDHEELAETVADVLRGEGMAVPGGLLDLLAELDQADVTFASATEPFDTSTSIGRMLVQLLGVFAEFERETIIDRVTAGMNAKAAKGKWPGGRLPYGYQLDPATHKLVPDPAQAPIVRGVFRLYTRDRLGTRAIAAQLNARGLRTRPGKPWSGHVIALMLVLAPASIKCTGGCSAAGSPVFPLLFTKSRRSRS
jgi:DNA invertase Pin-like site-specific DNA recombinase